MEYVDGLDLSELARRQGPLRTTDASELIRQAALGLQCAHEHGLVHRDIKPSNLMLTPQGLVKVLDLGLARLHSAESADEELTDDGQVMGTADYMSPEQGMDTHAVDIRADIYSLGCTFYRLLAGQTPFSNSKYDTPLSKAMAHVRVQIPSITELRDDLPGPLLTILDRMLAKEPAERFTTPIEVAHALASFSAGSDLPGLLGEARQRAPAPAQTNDSGLNTDHLHASAEPAMDPGRSEPPVLQNRPATEEESFDPYHRWLGIPPDEQPAHHYSMLDIRPFEDDPEVIRDAAARQMAHVRTYQLGKHVEISQQILNELAAAKACLSDWKKKVAYDARLRQKLQPVSAAPTPRPPVVSPEPQPPDTALASLATTAGGHFPSIRPRVAGKKPPQWKLLIATGAAAAAAILLLGIVFNVITNHGTVKITLSDPTADVAVEVDGDLVEITGLDEPLSLRGGEHGLEVTGKNFDTVSKSFTVRRGENPVLSIQLVPKEEVPGEDDPPQVAATPGGPTTEAASRAPQEDRPEFSVLKGHTAAVYSVAFTPDGRYAVSGSMDCSARVWDLATGQEMSCFLGHGEPVGTVAVLSDGKRVLSKAGNTMILWELQTADVIRRFQIDGFRGGIAVLPDGKRAICNTHLDDRGGPTGGGVELFDLATGEKLGRAPVHTHGDDIKTMACSSDGKWALCGMWDATVRVIDLNTMSEVKQLSGHTQQITGVATARRGHLAASVSWDSTVRIWDLSTQKLTALLGGLNGWGHGVDISPDGRHALSTGQDGIVRLFDTETGDQIEQYDHHEGPVYPVAISPDGRWALSGGADKTLCHWRLPPLKDEVEDPPASAPVSEMGNVKHLKRIRSMAFSPDGKILATGGEDKKLHLWDGNTGRLLWTLPGIEETIANLKFSPDGKLLATVECGEKNAVKVWQLAQQGGNWKATLKWQAEIDVSPFAALDFSPDGRVLASNPGLLWEADTGKEVRRLDAPTMDLAFGRLPPDGTVKPRQTVLATVAHDLKLRLWDPASGKLLHELDHGIRLNAVAFSPDGSLVASAGDTWSTGPGSIKLWDARTGTLKATLNGHPQGIESIAFSPDGSLLASGGMIGEVVLWDMATMGRERDTLHNQEARIEVVFCPTSGLLATADSQVRFGPRTGVVQPPDADASAED